MSVGLSDAPAQGGEAAYLALFDDALRAARDASASDLHVEPTREGVVLRMRVYGEMQAPWKTLGRDHRQPFITQVKLATGLEIGTIGKPQDGRLAAPSLGLDLRVNLLPTLYGEKVVLRLLEVGRAFDLDALGMSPEARGEIDRVLRCSDGVALISGPTGSGKTTTLYTMLCAIDRRSTNIVTLEDPIEYSIDGVNQVQMDRKLSFAAALRAVLRQDPDVILVGEIRDRETAELAFQAAATGHLVLSTVHANSAAQVMTRLAGLGVDPYLMEANLRFAGAQRLVRRLCRPCSRTATQAEVDQFCADVQRRPGSAGVSGGDLRVQGDGCTSCRGGVVGRLPLIEYVDEDAIKVWKATGTAACHAPIGETFINLALRGEVDIREAGTYV